MTSRRLDRVQEYYFSKKLREVRAMIASGKPVIDRRAHVRTPVTEKSRMPSSA